MVSTTATVKENGMVATKPPKTPTLPPGKYNLVGLDLDLTGRRLIDEICHIAAYTPTLQFSQYVMPFKDLNVAAKSRHLLRVVTVGKYRMLKSAKTGKVLKTKSEISAMTDFVQWLEDLKSDGIILITHEPRKTVAPFLIEVLRKYDLYDRFRTVVKGFANSFVFAEQKCAQTVKSYSLFTLGRVLLDKEEDLDSAADRARLAYEIVEHLCAGDEEKGDAPIQPAAVDLSAMSEAIRLISNNLQEEEKELSDLKELLERQNSLRPIFGDMISSRIRPLRYRASNLRRLIAEANLTYFNLEEAWKKDKKESLTALVNEKITTAKKPEDLEALIDMLLTHFDPEHKPKKPQPPPQQQQRRSKNNPKSQSEGNGTVEENGEKVNAASTTSEKASKTSSGKSSPGKFTSATSSPNKTSDEKGDVDTSR